MSRGPDKPEEPFLRRWSQRKLAATREAEPTPPAAPVAPPGAGPQPPAPARATADSEPPPESAPPSLPDVASLTFDSDYRPFVAPGVDEGTRRAALRKLFSDPHFNTMDGLDVYIDDYSKFEPITPEVLKQLRHARYLFDPPRTRVNEHGHVEDVVDDPAAGGAAAPEIGDAQRGDDERRDAEASPTAGEASPDASAAAATMVPAAEPAPAGAATMVPAAEPAPAGAAPVAPTPSR